MKLKVILNNFSKGDNKLKLNGILNNHLKYKDKNMKELIEERQLKQLKRQNDLRRKYLPEKYNPNLDKK